jgi:hypothetical protein
MTKSGWVAPLLGAVLGLSACGADEGGGGEVGPSCTDVSQCASDGCCGQGTQAVAISQRPTCPATCNNGFTPYDLRVDNGCGLVDCPNFHCVVARTSGMGCP